MWMTVNRCVFLFFFKQKTAYELRISDWSSDVCSSDLHFTGSRQAPLGGLGRLVHGSSLCAQAAALDSPPIARRAEGHCYAKQKGRPDRGGPSLVSDWRGTPWRLQDGWASG